MKRIPGPHYVYECYDATGRLMYVGCSKNVPARLKSHSQTQWWWPTFAKARAWVYPTQEIALAEEKRRIVELHPRWNTRDMAPRTQWTREHYEDYVHCRHMNALNTSRWDQYGYVGGVSEHEAGRIRAEYRTKFGLDILITPVAQQVAS